MTLLSVFAGGKLINDIILETDERENKIVIIKSEKNKTNFPLLDEMKRRARKSFHGLFQAFLSKNFPLCMTVSI